MKRIIAEIRQFESEYKLYINDVFSGKFDNLKAVIKQAEYFTGKNRKHGYIRHIIQLEPK